MLMANPNESNMDSDDTRVDIQTNLTTIPKDTTQCWKSGAKYCIMTFCCLNVVMLFVGGLWPALKGYSLHYHKEVVLIQTDKPVHVVSDKFLSVALDSSLVARQWDKFDFRSPSLQSMAAALSPCYLRLGGTAADRIIFEEHDNTKTNKLLPMDGGACANEGELCSKYIDNFTMSGEDFILINRFANKTGMKLIFDLNVLLRKGSDWNDSNAKMLLKFAEQHKFQIDWQLGNEPNAFRHVFGVSIPATQLGLDFRSLRGLLNSFPLYENSSLVGPDITRPRLPEQDDLEFLREFLREAGPELNAVTWHQYYLNGREAILQDFLNVETFNKLYVQISLIKKAVRNMALNTPIWLGETGSAYGGGAPELSDRFVAGFLWLDKLGIAATQGLDIVIRQSLFGGHYGLINNDLEPTPDFWLSVLYKSLVGRGVLNATQLSNNNKGLVRIYCHCTAQSSRYAGLGSMTLFGFNLRSSNVELSLQGPHNVSSVHRYILKGENGLQSKYILLNGVRLKLLSNGTLPYLNPQLMDLSSSIILPPRAIGFWVLHGAQMPACQQS